MAILFLYRICTILLSPLVFIWLLIRLYKGKEEKSRFNERLGFPRKKREKGKLIWFHGASVGECLSMMPLIKKILEENQNLQVMVTSGTVTSAALMATRLPKRAFHQFLPIDFPWAVKKFVSYWHPDLALWFESEFWPNMLCEIHRQKIPLVLLNGRISDKSFARWQKVPYVIHAVQSLFSLSLGQSQEDARRLRVLGANDAVSVGNLKFAAVSSPFDMKELKALKKLIGDRPCWCMASTHPNEEEMGAVVHTEIKKEYKNLLTVFAPRHPDRGDEIEKMLKKKGLRVARRSRGETITPQTDAYLADTIGEMGLIYQLAFYVFVGGSLIPFGGQNMLEPMRLRRAVFIGPYAFNFREIVARAKKEKALIEVKDKEDLTKQLLSSMMKPDAAEKMSLRGEALATSEMSVLDRVYRLLNERFQLK